MEKGLCKAAVRCRHLSVRCRALAVCLSWLMLLSSLDAVRSWWRWGGSMRLEV
jgi:hypothetical protein